MYIIIAVVLAVICISASFSYRKNRSVRSILEQSVGLVEVNPRKVLADIGRIDRTFLSEYNKMLCNVLEAGALITLEEYNRSDSLLNFASPYFKYKKDSLRLAGIYYHKGRRAHGCNFLLEAIEYFTLCNQYSNEAYDSLGLHFHLNSFKGQVYHIKRMDAEEKEVKLAALRLAKESNNPQRIREAYSGLIQYYTKAGKSGQSISLLKEAASMGYSDSLQMQALFLLSEQYADHHNPDSALLYARQIPRLYRDSVNYLFGKIYLNLGRIDSARIYLNKSTRSTNPALCVKIYRRLMDLNIRTHSIEGVSHCRTRLEYYQKLVDSLENSIMLSQIEDVEVLRKTIRDAEAAEVVYYQYWIVYFWVMVAAFGCILILLSVVVALRKKKRDLQIKRQQARLDALKMQIDPHFIFNNLSILLDLVETGNKVASDYVQALSKVYRYIVSNVDNNLSSVEEELSSLENYIFLLKIRFEEAVRFEIRVEGEARGRRIPPVVLQMILENAIKHNRVCEEDPLCIRIYLNGDKLVIENDRKPIAVTMSTYHIGLRNIRERYSLIGAPAPEIYEDEHIYRVTLSTV